MVDRRERVGRSVRDFRHLRGVENGPYVSSTRRRPLSPRLSRQTRRGAMAPGSGGGRRRGGQTGRHVSLRVIKVGPRYGGSCTAPVATKAPHRRPSLSPLTLSLFPSSILPLADIQPLVAPGGIDTAAIKSSLIPTDRRNEDRIRGRHFFHESILRRRERKKKKKEGAYTFDLIDKIDRRE